jgi:hypothetical protein
LERLLLKGGSKEKDHLKHNPSITLEIEVSSERSFQKNKIEMSCPFENDTKVRTVFPLFGKLL